MPLFNVEVFAMVRTVHSNRVEIEAATAEEAERIALELCDDGDINLYEAYTLDAEPPEAHARPSEP